LRIIFIRSNNTLIIHKKFEKTFAWPRAAGWVVHAHPEFSRHKVDGGSMVGRWRGVGGLLADLAGSGRVAPYAIFDTDQYHHGGGELSFHHSGISKRFEQVVTPVDRTLVQEGKPWSKTKCLGKWGFGSARMGRSL
jgi:hypothetical protein